MILRSLAIALSAGKCTAHTVNAEDYRHMRHGNMQASPSDIVDKVLKSKATKSIDGSPANLQRSKLDLSAMVHTFGMPQFLMTVTMNETGATAGTSAFSYCQHTI